MGFMTSREALSILPPEQLTNTPKPKKRKADHPSTSTKFNGKTGRPKQATLKTWFTNDVPSVRVNVAKAPIKRDLSSGIIHDRGKALHGKPVLPALQQMSSPSRGYDIDALPAAFSSSPTIEPVSPLPKKVAIGDIPTSPLIPTDEVAKDRYRPTLGFQRAQGMTVIPPAKKTLGMRRAMKPWPSKK